MFDKDELLEKSKKHIFELYKLLEGNRLNLIINGYTDNEGEDLYNKKLLYMSGILDHQGIFYKLGVLSTQQFRDSILGRNLPS